MKIVFDKSFLKSIDHKLPNQIARHLNDIITEIELSNDIHRIPGVKKLSGFKKYYRIRIGDYRLGFELENKTTIRMIIICHRKDIYKLFP
jgi:mRNA interferase RelE/StbE